MIIYELGYGQLGWTSSPMPAADARRMMASNEIDVVVLVIALICGLLGGSMFAHRSNKVMPSSGYSLGPQSTIRTFGQGGGGFASSFWDSSSAMPASYSSRPHDAPPRVASRAESFK